MKNHGSLKSSIIFTASISLLFSITLFSQTTYTISDPEELENETYIAGDVIILTNGIYDTDERIDFVGNGEAGNPITFRAENPGGVKFTGGLKMNIGGDYVVVDGFHWEGGYGASNFIQFRNGTDYANHSIIQNCAIDGLAIHPDDIADDIEDNSITKHRWIVLYGTYNTVINCSFLNKESAGALVLTEYEYNAEEDPCAVVGHTISNNYFYKYAKVDENLSNANDSETIRIGTSEYQNVNSNVTVSNNYFVEADGENEIITNKSKGNIYTNNTFRRCRGSLVLRHGSEATVDGNYFIGENVDGTGGIRITDANHNITNNYIQDCITVLAQAKWNNGITFLGGGDSAAVPCTSSNVSNGYQKSENINVSNNSIVNTNAPLFYNTDKGSTDPTGIVSDNLIYYAPGDPNTSDLITGDTPSSYDDLGTSLTYTGNVYSGTNLGQTNMGFTEEAGIMATSVGEIFTFSGTGSLGKGADMGTYLPTTDDKVGYGIGACFLNNLGAGITDGDCSIVFGEYLTVGSLPTFSAEATSEEVTVNSNVNWTAVSNDSWISIDTNSGMGNATVSIMVTANSEITSRSGTVTFTQDPGGDDIERTLTVTQEGIELTDLYDLINIGTGLPEDQVTVHSFSREEVNGVDKFNYAKNTLDKDNETVWAADDDDIVTGDYKGDGEYIIYDFSGIADIDLLQFTTTNKSEPFGFQIWVSSTGTDDSDFSKVLPTSGDLIFTATNTTDFNQFQINIPDVRYLKIIGFGRFNSDGDTRTSVWSAVGEIEFYGSLSLSTDQYDSVNPALIFPNPTKNLLQIKNMGEVDFIRIYGMDGEIVMDKILLNSESEIELDLSKLLSGSYILVLQGASAYQSKQFMIID